MSLLSYNIEGITSKLKDKHFISFVSGYDIVCLVETFVNSFSSNSFPSFTSFVAPAKKLSHHGRSSGGVIVLVKDAFSKFVRQIDTSVENTVVLELDREVLGSESSIFLINTYLTPYDSPFYDTSDFDNGISMLEQCLLEILQQNEDATFILCGDFNARTANKVPSYVDIALSRVDNSSGNFWNRDWENYEAYSRRWSQDTGENMYGEKLLRLCSCFDLFVLNGMREGDGSGNYTYISPRAVASLTILFFHVRSRLCQLRCVFRIE